AEYVAHEFWCSSRDRWRHLDAGCDVIRHFHFIEMFKRAVHRTQVHRHDDITALAVSLLDRLLDGRNRLILGQHAADGEEAHLHNRIDVPAHAAVACHLDGVDDVEASLPFDKLFLHHARQVTPGIVWAVRRIEQEHAAWNQPLEHVVALKEYR